MCLPYKFKLGAEIMERQEFSKLVIAVGRSVEYLSYFSIITSSHLTSLFHRFMDVLPHMRSVHTAEPRQAAGHKLCRRQRARHSQRRRGGRRCSREGERISGLHVLTLGSKPCVFYNRSLNRVDMVATDCDWKGLCAGDLGTAI